VAPKEVEDVLHMLAGVTAAVVGVPDPVAGEVVKAFVVCGGEPLTESKVVAHCRAHLEDHKVPTYIEFRSELPTTPSGKVDKTSLR
jgi:acyl-CoA synthetase (AMP-forming)/AMP-acid ligase II